MIIDVSCGFGRPRNPELSLPVLAQPVLFFAFACKGFDLLLFPKFDSRFFFHFLCFFGGACMHVINLLCCAPSLMRFHAGYKEIQSLHVFSQPPVPATWNQVYLIAPTINSWHVGLPPFPGCCGRVGEWRRKNFVDEKFKRGNFFLHGSSSEGG